MKKIETITIGTDNHLGNIVGIQPVMNEIDYSTADSFKRKIRTYFISAQEDGFINDKSIVVFPEYIGTWLVGLNSSTHKLNTINQAMFKIIVQHPISFLKHFLVLKNFEKAIFNIKASEMLSAYYEVFSELAKEFQMTIIAGSILLPNPKVKNGKIQISPGSLFNSSFVFMPDGHVYDKFIKKVFLVEDEAKFTAPGQVSDLPVFHHRIGKIAVLICADSWFEEPYNIIDKKRADILIVPSYLYPNKSWNNHWKGDKDRKTNLSEKEAWLKFAMAGKLSNTNINYGINVFLRGNFWGIGSDGETTTYQNKKASTLKGKELITNLWIEN